MENTGIELTEMQPNEVDERAQHAISFIRLNPSYIRSLIKIEIQPYL